jgi:MoxR-like ATPase
MSVVRIFTVDSVPEKPDPDRLAAVDTAPPWRRYVKKNPEAGLLTRAARAMDEDQVARGKTYVGKAHEADLVNAALCLRRPLLITGNAGVGKSTLAYAVAYQLGLGNVLRWGVTSRSTLKDALYQYDAIARLHETSVAREAGLGSTNPTKPRQAEDVGQFITLGPLGTALLPTRADGYFPRVLLVDEIDKSDADLPSDLLHVLEEGSFYIPEIGRHPDVPRSEWVTVRTLDRGMPEAQIPRDGWVRCDDFPFIVMTSNGERDFPPAFLRRCLRLEIKRQPGDLQRIVEKHLADAAKTEEVRALIDDFLDRVDKKKATLATDQLLNAIFLLHSGFKPLEKELANAILRSLNESPTGGTGP